MVHLGSCVGPLPQLDVLLTLTVSVRLYHKVHSAFGTRLDTCHEAMLAPLADNDHKSGQAGTADVGTE